MKCFAVTLLLLVFGSASLHAQLLSKQDIFTKADSLRGSLTHLRTCYDINYYHLDVAVDLEKQTVKGSNEERILPNDPELPMILDKVYPCHEIVKIDYFLPGCAPRAELIWQALVALLTNKPMDLPYEVIKFD